MRKTLFALVAGVALAGCTAGPAAKAPVPGAGERQVMTTQVRAPSLADMKRHVPAALTPREAASRLLPVRPDQVRLPGPDRKTQQVILSTIPSIQGFYPFTYLSTLGCYSPFGYWPTII